MPVKKNKTTKKQTKSKAIKSRTSKFNKLFESKKIILAIFLILFTSVGVYKLLQSRAAVSVFQHPGILVSQNQLDFIKTKVQNNEEPWTSSYNKMKSSPLAKKTYTPSPVPKLMCSNSAGIADGIPQVGCKEMNDDAAASYIQALMYVITGEKVYAENSAKIINAWASTLKEIPFDEIKASNGNPGYWQNILVVGWSTETMTRGAEIIRYTSNALSSNDIVRSEKWFKDLVYSFLSNNSHVKNGTANGGQTWVEALVNIGVYTNDHDIYEQGIRWYKTKSPQLVYLSKDGTKPAMPTDAESGKPWYGTVDEHWRYPTQYINGQSTETCRDMGHTFMGLGPYANTAETALIQGTHDLYAENEDRFLAAFELNAGYVNQLLDRMAQTGQTAKQVTESKWKPIDFPCKEFKDGGQSAFFGTELAYNHFVNRRGRSMPQTKKLAERTRPQTGGNHMFYETLTHANTGNVGISSTQTPSQPSSPTVSSTTLNATDDTYVRDGNYANTSYGSSSVLPTTQKDPSNGYTRWSYVKFNLPKNENTEIVSAKVQVNARLSTGPPASIEVYAVPETSWSGSTMTWNNKPTISEKVGEYRLDSSDYGWKEIDVSQWTKNQVAQNKSDIAFAFRQADNGPGFGEFRSLESSTKPQLIIEEKILSNPPGPSPVPAINQPPIVQLISTATNYVAPAEINLTASASDVDGQITKVEFYYGSTKIGESTKEPYSFTWKNVKTGEYSVTARAFDDEGATATSSPVTYKIDAPVQQPINDTQKPTTPTSLAKKLEKSQNKYNLSLSWRPSTDNVGVKNYLITRNNLSIGTTASTFFTDINFNTGTNYNYSIQAIDEAGNVSNPAKISAKANCFLIWCFL